MKHMLPERLSHGWYPPRKPDGKTHKSFSLLLFDSPNQGSYEAGRPGLCPVVIKTFPLCIQCGFNFLKVHSGK